MYGFIGYQKITCCTPECPDRTDTCHATCEQYLAQRAANEAKNLTEAFENDANGFRATGVYANKARMGKSSRMI